MPTAADQIIVALRCGHDSLLEFVNSLGPDGVTHSSGASEWTVAQVLSHLGSGAEITLAGLDAALTDEDGRPEGFNQSVWDRWDAKSPQDQAADSLRANEALVSRYEGIDSATRESVRFELGFLPQPVDLAAMAGLRHNEFVLHSWDVVVGFDPAATLRASDAGLLLDGQPLLFGWRGKVDALNGARGTLAVNLTEPDRTFGVDFGDKISLTDLPSTPAATFSGPAEAWIRLSAGRLAPIHTPASVSVTGDLVSLEDLRRIFPGY